MPVWPRLPLLSRLLFVAGLILLAAVGLVFYTTVKVEAEHARSDLQMLFREELSVVPLALAEPLVVGDYAAVQQTLEHRIGRPEIASLSFVDSTGATLLASSSIATPQQAPDWFRRWVQLGDLSGSADVSVGGRYYGKIEIRISAQNSANRVWRLTVSGFYIQVLAIVSALIGIWLALRSSLRSIRVLSQASAAIGQGDMAIQVAPQGSPELRNTIQAFNRMVRTVGETQDRLTVEKEKLAVTLASIADAVIATGRDGRVDYMNPVAELLTGWSSGEARGHPLGEVLRVVDGTTREPVADPLRPVYQEGRVVSRTEPCLLNSRDGREYPISASAAPIRAQDHGEVIGAVLVFRDRTEEREYLRLLRLSASVFEHTQEGILITDADARILDVNPAFTALTGYSREEVIGQKPSILKSSFHKAEFYSEMWAAIVATGQWRGEIWNRRKDGELVVELLTITSVPAEDGGKEHYVGVFTDITELKTQQQHLEHIAHYDALTQLPNRVLLADRLGVALANSRRQGNLLAVCYMDLDDFKPVNDTFGHEAGDRLLVDLAQRLTMSLRAGDTVARLGGDEFVLLLSGLHNIEECRATLDRLLKAIARPYDIHGHPVLVSASIGVTLYPHDDTDPDTLLRHADQAMYAAKENGRNGYHLFDPEHDRRAKALREAVSRIEEGIAGNEFVLYFQPKVDMRQGRVIGAEALVRWHHPLRGLLPPAEFLPLIENSDTAVMLDEWVIERALDHMADWLRRGLRLPVSVNISARHLQRTDMPARLAAALARHPTVGASDFELEILETSALDDILHASSLISECQRLGVTFALDDFGTGYSSLSYFKRLPAETLKIDQSFVRDMLRDTEDLAIVEGVIGLAEAFNRTVIAEGVETVAHGTLLLELGCDLAQGYGIARPMPADALPDWVSHWQQPVDWAGAIDTGWRRKELPLIMAEFELRVWLDDFSAWIQGDAAEPHEELAKPAAQIERWLNGPGRERHGQSPHFSDLEQRLRQFQALADELAALKHAGQDKPARHRLGDLVELGRSTVARLRLLSQGN